MLGWSNTRNSCGDNVSYRQNDNHNNDVITSNIVVFNMIHVKLEFCLINIYIYIYLCSDGLITEICNS